MYLRKQINHNYPNYETPSKQTVFGLSWDVIADQSGVKDIKIVEVPLTKGSCLSQI